MFPNGQDFETYLVTASPEYLEVVQSVIIASKTTNARHRQALEREWRAKDAAALITELQNTKTQYGPRLPLGFSRLANAKLAVPECIRRVLDLANPPLSESSITKGAT
jgi:hypothetical protein